MTVLKDYMVAMQDRLAAAGVDNPDLDARLLIAHVLDWPQTKLLLNLNQVLNAAEVKDLDAAFARRLQREPVSRIIGHRAFWKSEFKITPQTLDPRPDSETLVEGAVKLVQPAPEAILDLGTGTGCLLLSLLIEFPQANGVGVDISEEAVATARENAGALGLAGRAAFVTGDWNALPPLPAFGGKEDNKFDLLVSNPPYISEAEVPGLAPEVAQYDPLSALVSGPDGLECYRAQVRLIRKWLKPGGWALFEIGHTQSEAVKSILAEAGMTVLNVLPDLAGSDRVVVARRP